MSHIKSVGIKMVQSFKAISNSKCGEIFIKMKVRFDTRMIW